MSSIVICVNIYHLSIVKTFDIEFLQMLLFFPCVLTELFIYCWFGNELIIKVIIINNNNNKFSCYKNFK